MPSGSRYRTARGFLRALRIFCVAYERTKQSGTATNASAASGCRGVFLLHQGARAHDYPAEAIRVRDGGSL